MYVKLSIAFSFLIVVLLISSFKPLWIFLFIEDVAFCQRF